LKVFRFQFWDAKRLLADANAPALDRILTSDTAFRFRMPDFYAAHWHGVDYTEVNI
jgi:hypothetical protein